MLYFPRVLFHYWVVAYAEVTVDRMTVNRAIKVNHDYVCERTEMMVILLYNALMFLVKDNDRYVLRSFKTIKEQGCTGTSNLNSSNLSITSGNLSSTSTFTMHSGGPFQERHSIHVSSGIGTGLNLSERNNTTSNLSSASFNVPTLSSTIHSNSNNLNNSNVSSNSTLNSNHNQQNLTNVNKPTSTACMSSSLINFPSGSTIPTNSGLNLPNPTGINTTIGNTSSISNTHQSIVSVMANAAVANVMDRSSGSLKLPPIFPLQNMFTSCGEKSGLFENKINTFVNLISFFLVYK